MQIDGNSIAVILIVGVIIYILLSYVSRDTTPKVQENSLEYFENTESAKIQTENNNIDQEIIHASNFEIKEFIPDASIIDVTNNIIEKIPEKKAYSNILPYHWANIRIFSFEDINRADKNQRDFYRTVKESFLSNEYIDVKGYTNYIYLLLFDLIKEYDRNKDLRKLEILIRRFGVFYPELKDFADSTFSRVRANHFSFYHSEQSLNIYDDYWNLGYKYQDRLKLNSSQVVLLNKIWSPNTNFCRIEYCLIETLKLYLILIDKISIEYQNEGSTFEKQISFVANKIATRHYNYSKGSDSYNYSIENIDREIFTHIFKHCENAVRDFYNHKRKLNTDIYNNSKEVKKVFDSLITAKVNEILPSLIYTISEPDEQTEIELNSQNTNRWKIKFEEITQNYKNNTSEFIESILSIGKLNKTNPQVENIFYEASKFISKYDKVATLTLYLHYIYFDMQSSNFDNKQLNKSVQKGIFKTNEQLINFENIVADLIKNKNIEKAINETKQIFEPKRKRIELDKTAIKEVQQQHSGTVELLNEYLREEIEDEKLISYSKEALINKSIEEKKPNNVDHHKANFVSELCQNKFHIEILEIFLKNNLSVPQLEIEKLSKSRGIFKNQIIDSINETCYDLIDDILIEEQDDNYIITSENFQKIKINDR